MTGDAKANSLITSQHQQSMPGARMLGQENSSATGI